MEVFTPLNETRSKRLKFPLSDVQVLSGSLNLRKRGFKALVSILGQRYKVIGCSCGLSGCLCDAYIISVN